MLSSIAAQCEPALNRGSARKNPGVRIEGERIIVVTGNSLDDISLLESVFFVMKGGEVFRHDN